MSSRKSLLISEIFPPRHGGSGRWFFELYRRMPTQSVLMAVGETAGAPAYDARHSDELDLYRLPLTSPSWGLRSVTGLKFYLRCYREITGLAKKRQIAAVHCGRCLPEGVLGLLLHLRLGLPYLCYVHGEDIQTASESRELSWIIRRVFASASRLIANSQNSARLLREDWHVSDEKISVLLPGMDASHFVPTSADSAFLGLMGWDGKRVILTVGRLQRRKGQDMLIRALPGILRKNPDVLYAIVGDGAEHERLETLAQENGVTDQVQFLGEVDDATLIRCYQHCTLFALPNRSEGRDIEGFGMVLAEAQACGKPVLAGDSGGTRETMIVGETGVVVDCTSPEPLAEALVELLARSDSELADMGSRGREHVRSTLDWPMHVAQARDIFDELLAPPANPLADHARVGRDKR